MLDSKDFTNALIKSTNKKVWASIIILNFWQFTAFSNFPWFRVFSFVTFGLTLPFEVWKLYQACCLINKEIHCMKRFIYIDIGCQVKFFWTYETVIIKKIQWCYRNCMVLLVIIIILSFNVLFIYYNGYICDTEVVGNKLLNDGWNIIFSL